MFFSRLISWIILVALFTAAIFIKEARVYILSPLFVFGGFMAVYEILDMLKKIGYKSFKRAAAAVAAITVIFIFFAVLELNIIPVTLFVIGLWGYLLFSKKEKAEKELTLKKTAVSIGGLLLGLLPIFFLCRIFYFHRAPGACSGAELLLYLVAVTKTGDTFAYITGMLSNKILKGKNHKIVPSISPKKSWEGTIGGMVFAVVVSFLLFYFMFDAAGKSMFFPLIMGIALFWGGFFGDLAESALKRACGVKDSGRILPGMGGVNDLLDSFIFNAPLFYFYLLIMM